MIDFTTKPRGFVLCVAADTECPLAATCLRSLAYRHLEEEKDSSRKIEIINPKNKQLHYATSRCDAYMSNQAVTYARGMKHLFDDVKQSMYKLVRLRVMNCFSCDSFFYSSRNGQRLITPEEQARIAQVFKDMNVGAEPRFDSYVTGYAWK